MHPGKIWACAAILGASALAGVSRAGAQQNTMTLADIEQAISRTLEAEEAQVLADRLRDQLGAANLVNGLTPKLDKTKVLFAIETAQTNPQVRDDTNLRGWNLTRLGDSNMWVTVGVVPNFRVVRWRYEAGGKSLNSGAVRVEYFPRHPDSLPRAGTPKGTVRQMPKLESKIFPGTSRDWWIYVPSQYREDQPACLMVFQDGQGYLNDASQTATVFDNLIHKGDMPVTIGVFINPGVYRDGRSNRSFEYDTLSDQYARFLRDEVLPETRKVARFSDDPERRAVCGISSGGICAFTAAWEMPDQFRKVLSQVGSFVNIAAGKSLKEGGHNYAALLRKAEKKPLRVFLQDGSNDLDNENGNWPLANQTLAATLSYRGYDYHFVMGEGFHSKAHGAAIFPDSLRWLWRDVR